VAISRVQVLGFSKGLPGPSEGFQGLLVEDVTTKRVHIRFVDGQDMMVRHENVCGRKHQRS